jgi:hypothetical protein
MAVTTFELQELSDDSTWDGLVRSSPQGTIFCSSAFLAALNHPYRRFVVTSKGQAVGLFPAIEDHTRTALIAPDFTPYQGILFVNSPNGPNRTKVLNELKISEFIIDQLTKRYRSISLRLSWRFEDIRPFQWYNFDAPETSRFQLTPYYTATLDLDGKDEAEIAANLRPCRRQEIRKTQDLAVVEENAVDKFVSLYRSTFSRQGIELSEEKVELAARICSAAIQNKFGRMTACYNGSEPIGMALFLTDSYRSYYLFGANAPNHRHSGGSTKLIWDNILYLRSAGLREIDFVGVNSPHRGDFKLSFNPELRLYFRVDYACQS